MATAERDYFTDMEVLRDPYSWFEEQRAKGPVAYLPERDMYVVTGFAEAVEALLNTEDLSNYAVTTPDLPLPFTPEGDDLTAQVEANRGNNPMLDLLVAYDGQLHTNVRSLLTKLFIPSRLKANEEYMRRVSEEMVGELVSAGKAEIIHQLSAPFVTLVIADLLGVPADDREKFREVIDAGSPAGNMDKQDARDPAHALMFMGGFFMKYVAERRENPGDDVMSELATATFPDGTMPEALEVVKAAMFLFAAGQDTSAKLLGNSVRHLCDNPELQARLRADFSLIPGFIEEMLRMEGSTKMTSRLALRDTQVGGVDIPVGKRVIIGLAAANRDPRRWEKPLEFAIGRRKIHEHLAFGRGKHVCIGAPLARAEVKVLLETLLSRTSDIRLSQEHYGADGSHQLEYEPSYIIRGLENLHVELDPA